MLRRLNVYLALIESEEDQNKFEILYRQYERLMFGKAKSILHDPYLAEDALQQAFLYVAKHIDKIEDPISERTKALLLLVTKHNAYDVVRKERRIKNQTVDYEEAETVATPDFAEFVGDDKVSIAIHSLPEEYCTAVILRYMFQYTAKEIASMMNCTVAKAEKLVSRGTKRLIKILEEMQE